MIRWAYLDYQQKEREREREIILTFHENYFLFFFRYILKWNTPLYIHTKKKKKKKKGTVSLWHGVAFLFVLPCSWWWSFHLHELSTNQRLFWTWKIIIDGFVYSLHQAHFIDIGWSTRLPRFRSQYLDYNFFH